ncbi:MAG: AraC family ligand binding domain-containing protein, partial [Treponema sp.]|nr:AraC family ligand binding domain-containing protein [Treponema sp.]
MQRKDPDNAIQNKEITEALQPFDCSLNVYTNKPHFYHLHWHDSIELILVKKGCLWVHVQKKKFRINENELFVMLPGELHSTESSGKGVLEYFVLTFDPGIFLNYSYENRDITLIYFFLANNQSLKYFLCGSQDVKNAKIVSLMNSVLNELNKKDPGYAFAIKADVSKIFLWLLRY